MARKITGLPLEELRAAQIKAQEEFHQRQAKMPYLKKVRLVGDMQGMVKMWKEAKIESSSTSDEPAIEKESKQNG